ncbi:MAG: hypothetical protein PHO08_15250 [Methylococcales bacterium]|nr:hypothetical protein [Methylococcales bacterium]MDD5631240.1 hypothetical protein [Methylococcales bacterium]
MNITALRVLFTAEGNPVISVDAKKKEQIGNLFRDGKVYTTKTVVVFEHDSSYPPYTSKMEPH